MPLEGTLHSEMHESISVYDLKCAVINAKGIFSSILQAKLVKLLFAEQRFVDEEVAVVLRHRLHRLGEAVSAIADAQKRTQLGVRIYAKVNGLEYPALCLNNIVSYCLFARRRTTSWSTKPSHSTEISFM